MCLFAAAEMRGTRGRATSYDSPDEFDDDSNNAIRKTLRTGGRIIMLGDGSGRSTVTCQHTCSLDAYFPLEMQTDKPDDVDMFEDDHGKNDEKDEEALEKVAAKEAKKEDADINDASAEASGRPPLASSEIIDPSKATILAPQKKEEEKKKMTA